MNDSELKKHMKRTWLLMRVLVYSTVVFVCIKLSTPVLKMTWWDVVITPALCGLFGLTMSFVARKLYELVQTEMSMHERTEILWEGQQRMADAFKQAEMGLITAREVVNMVKETTTETNKKLDEFDSKG